MINESKKIDNSREHKLADAGQLVIAVLFLSVYITDTFFLGFSIYFDDIIPNIIRILLGLLLLVFAGVIGKKGHDMVFKENKEQGIINNGVFAIVRHPIYSSEIMVYAGLLILSFSMISFFIFIIGAVFLYYISKYEEKILFERFGREYAEYIRKTPMFIPCLYKMIKRE